MEMDAQDSKHQIALLIERQRYAQAASLLSDTLAKYPDDADLLYSTALIDYLMRRKEAAYETLRHLLTRTPTHVNGRSLMAQLHEDRNELASAEALWLELLKEYPESGWLYAKYAMLMYRAFHIAKARALAKEALRLAPESEDALIAHLLGQLIAGDRAAEKDSLAELIRKHPENLATMHMLVTHLSQQGKYVAAKRIAIEILRLQPDSREALTLVVELEHVSHWSMLPLWPLNRWGWAASGGLWLACLIALAFLRKQAPDILDMATTCILSYVAYSWIYPPILKRWLMRRAGL